jgi:hypothetical protein
LPTIKYQNTFTAEIEKKIIKSLKAKNPHGYNEISVKILKLSSPFISKLIKSYLKNRYQRVLMGGKSSYHSNYLEWGKIIHGVPQGFILGPLLFLFNINDLLNIVHYNSKPTLYADDTSLIVSNPSYLDFKSTINNVFSQLNDLMIIYYF